MIGHLESSIGSQVKPGQFPQPVLEPSEVILAIDTDFFHHLLIEVVKEFRPSVAAFVVNLRFQFALELVELYLNLHPNRLSLENTASRSDLSS